MIKTQKQGVLFVFGVILMLGFSANVVFAANELDSCQKKVGVSCEELRNNLKMEEILQKTDLSQLEDASTEKMSLSAESEVKTLSATSEATAESSEDEVIEINGDEEWSENKTFKEKRIKVNSGAELKIKAGVQISFENSIIVVYGKLIMEGTKENPIVLKKTNSENNEGYVIASSYDFNNESIGEIDMQYVDVSGGDLYGENIGAIYIDVGTAKIENCNFHDNKSGFGFYYMLSGSKVNHSKFYNNKKDINSLLDTSEFLGEELALLSFNLEYNWWGSVNGPEKNEDGAYEKIIGEVDFEPWFSSEDFYDPVIIIPGILGSEKRDGIWQLDPVFHTYDNLYEAFVANGFVAEKSVFTFPYEWRDSNIENAKILKEKIAEIKQITGIPRVDIVAHSMGGLLAREYIESGYYQNDVDQLITLGTPHNGAPEAYMKWEAGEFLYGPSDLYLKRKFFQEAKENGYENIFDYIQGRPILSVKELLPTYSYLYDVQNNNELRAYPNNYPINDFLENLNSNEKKEKMKNVSFYKIVGNTEDDSGTISGFNVMNTNMGKYWNHGYPYGFEIPIGNRGLIKGNGDETVPLESAISENIPDQKTVEINSTHRKLPTEAQVDVLEILNGQKPTEEVRHSLIRDILFVSVFSPVDIQIIDPDGLRVGKDFATGEILNEIDGAYYSGFETENEFLTIPKPKEGEYRIITEGTGEGEYKIKVARITEDEITGETTEIGAEMTGMASIGEQEEATANVSKSEIIIEEKDKIAPVVTVNSPIENESYLNNQVLTVDFSLEDNKTSADKIVSKMYLDGNVITDKNIVLSLQNLGEHVLKITAADEAGNLAEKELKFNVETNIPAIKANIRIYSNQKLLDEHDEHFMLSELRMIEKLQRFIAEMESHPFFKHRHQEKVIETLKKNVNEHLEWLKRYVQKRSEEKNRPRLKSKFEYISIDKKIAELLIEDFEFVKYE